MPESSRNLTVLLIVLSLIVLGGGGYLAFDQYNQLTAKSEEITKLEGEKIAQEQKIKELEDLMTEFEKVKKDASRVNQVLPAKENIPELIYQLEAIASKEAGVHFASASFSETSENESKAKADQQPTDAKAEGEEKKIQKVAITLGIEGTYQGLKDYLNAIQENIRILDITSISFQAQAAEEGGEVYRYSIGMTAYFVN